MFSSSGDYKADSTAFLFSLTNPSNIPLKLKTELPEKAVYHISRYGPLFGNNGNDLCVSSLSNTNRKSYMNFSSYEFPNGMSGNEGGKFIVGDYNFLTTQIEVFQVL